ncbi:hypothetical protein AX768_11920 [Burkholderia sp. PAMC 28687]|uniref:Uncharacterized protein n=1 Tax=Caballeronia sordidicola TaxID=196367 RepID=A0A242N251_CABSO|nr:MULTISPECIES: hypothetical protein [Burkholderiaceae]AMM14695.1 hypothetical protein AX768_11920 [Burkholderia sp. PAMC 28687]OTP77642.1 hypothetical protein PAMC26510_08215 [Caballeronia sordidicola]
MNDGAMFFGDAELMAEAMVLAQTVISIRTARGKRLPRDFSSESPELEAVALEFADDIVRVFAGECD